MILNPLRLYRRRRRLLRDALEEAQNLRRHYGPEALEAAHAKLARPELTRWGRQVMRQAIKDLKKAR